MPSLEVLRFSFEWIEDVMNYVYNRFFEQFQHLKSLSVIVEDDDDGQDSDFFPHIMESHSRLDSLRSLFLSEVNVELTAVIATI